jgi:hypothetical protein
MGDGVVGLGALLQRLLGRGQPSSVDRGLYISVRCDACGEIIQARINPGAELSLNDDGQSYFVRKVLVGQQCFRPIEVLVRYADQGGRTEVSRDVHGGTSVQ